MLQLPKSSDRRFSKSASGGNSMSRRSSKVSDSSGMTDELTNSFEALQIEIGKADQRGNVLQDLDNNIDVV
jgi:hypothetical protein